MFTFIRLAAMQVFHGHPSNSEREVESLEEQSMTPSNPWQRELDRLADGGLTRTPRRPHGSYLPKDEPVHKPKPRAGTIADLKVWWGKAITTYTPPNNVDVSAFAPRPVKKRNRWYNF